MNLQEQCIAAEQTESVTNRALQMRRASGRKRHQTESKEERGLFD
jgi:hypothetical protein